MPFGQISDWENGPMGPGFFMMLPRYSNFYYDGGGMFDLIGEPSKTKEQQERMAELVALFLLMRCQC